MAGASSGVATASGINILQHLARAGIGSVPGELDSSVNLRIHLRVNPVQLSLVREFMADDPCAQQLDRIALGRPALFLFFRTVVLAAHITDVMAVIPGRVAQKKCGAFSRTRLLPI